MNYLAHATLSFGNAEILTGNMISDFVKGKKKLDYPLAIQNGIMLHRMIDEFTDTHAATKRAKACFKESAGAYAGVFVDVVYDHFLANDQSEFPADDLSVFSLNTYKMLSLYETILPERFRKMLPFMISQNWLYNYRFEKGIENSFAGLFRRAKYLESDPRIFEAFKENYKELNTCYNLFFPEVRNFASGQFNKFIN